MKSQPHRLPGVLSATLLAFFVLAGPAGAQAYLKSKPIGGNPGPAYNYICPNVDRGPALDCFVDAVRHLYTMCRHVKSIEIIEHGYEKSEEGVNGAKSEYCVAKQRQNMEPVYDAALREAVISPLATDMVKGIQEFWVDSLRKLAWTPGESDGDYKARTASVYQGLDWRIGRLRQVVDEVRADIAARKARRTAGKTAAAKAAP